MGRRVLITGLGTFWGGRMAQALEQDPDVEMIVGLDTVTPSVELERTEYVRADQSYSILSRIVRAAHVDTIVHTFLVVDSTRTSGRALHETNVIGTMNLLAAASAAGAPVRQIVVKSSSLVYGSSFQDPVWFREETPRTGPPTTRVESSLLEAEGYLRDFAEDNPHVVVTLLRFANVLGTEIVTATSQALERQTAPYVFGFDPLIQFVEEGDVVRCLEFPYQDFTFRWPTGMDLWRTEWRQRRALDDLLARCEPEAAVLWMMGGLSASLLARLRERGVPIVAMVHEQWPARALAADPWLAYWTRSPSRLRGRVLKPPVRALVQRLVAPLGALLIGGGLFLVGTWRPDTAPVLMVLTLCLHGLGLGFFQVAYMEIVLAASPQKK